VHAGLCTGALALTASAGAEVWPGPAPCDTTLQACIDGVASGAVVEVAGSADENLLIQKSVTLRAAPGQSGGIGGGTTSRVVRVQQTSPGSGAIVVAIEDLSLDPATVSVLLGADADHQVTIRSCSIHNPSPNADTRAIDLAAYVPATLVAADNVIATNGTGIALSTGLASGTLSATFLGNRITAVDPGLGASGIDLDLQGPGAVDVGVYSNLIHGVGGCCATASGIRIGLPQPVTSSIAIVNDTLDDVQGGSPGIYVLPPAVGALAAIQVFNDIVTRATAAPLLFPASATGLTIASGYDDLFDNNGFDPYYGGYPPGDGMVAVDPQFADPSLGDYHLAATSPAIDAGTASPPGGLPATDADGHPRAIGSAPDLGAFEAPEPGAAGCGAAAAGTLAARAGRRRRRARRAAG
jgi:hypothetical protein